MALEKVTFNPSDSVTYMPDNTKQMVTLTISNGGSQTITFKMKSTHPGRYKMRPVYGKVPGGDHTNVQLIYKGAKPGQQVSLKDHFSCVYSLCTSSTTDVKKIWKNHKFVREIANQDTKKHKWAILYKGYNDQQVEMTPAQNEISEKRVAKIKKGKGLVDEEEEKPAAPAPAAPAAGSKDHVQLVFREQACPLSDSGSDSEKEKDEEGDDEKKKKTGDQQTKSPKNKK